MESIFVEYFEYLLRQTLLRYDFSIKQNQKNIKLIEGCIRRLYEIYNISLSNGIIWDYLVYQFRYYSDKKTRFGQGNVQLNWVVGKEAIQRWDNREENWKYFNVEYCKKFNLQAPENREYKYQENKQGRYFFNQMERRRFYNTESGYLHCMENNLFEKYSKECIICRFRKDCSDDI